MAYYANAAYIVVNENLALQKKLKEKRKELKTTIKYFFPKTA